MPRVAISNSHAEPSWKQLRALRNLARSRELGGLSAAARARLENPELLDRFDASQLIVQLIKTPMKVPVKAPLEGASEYEELLPPGAYAVSPWDTPGCIIRVQQSRFSGAQVAVGLQLDWRTGSYSEVQLGTIKSLLEGESRLGPVRAPRPLPLEELVAFADISNYCLACGKKANDETCRHV